MTDTTKPGVQKPHWSPWRSAKACWTGFSEPSAGDRPSMVVTAAPSACTANSRHERTASPSSSTVHAPHTPCSHARCVPVSPQSSRRNSASVCAASTSRCAAAPLTVTVISVHTSWPPRARGRGPASQVRRHRRRYAAVPWMSSLGSVADAATAAAAGRSALSAGEPRRADSAASPGAVSCPCRTVRSRPSDCAGSVERDPARDAGDCEVAAPACELLDRESAARLPHRVPDGGENLVGLERGGPHRLEEVPRRDRAGTARPGHLHLGVERQRPPREVRMPDRRARSNRRPCRGCGSGSARCAAAPEQQRHAVATSSLCSASACRTIAPTRSCRPRARSRACRRRR